MPEGKTILLIIDPQRDFTDINGTKEDPQTGSLSIKGAASDYNRIAKLIDAYGSEIDEIHVTLDTHTVNHIGHWGYWKYKNSLDDSNYIDANNEVSGMSALTLDGENIVKKDKDKIVAYYSPKKDELLEYTKEYMKKHNLLKGVSMIWIQHCIEKTEGHKIADTIVTALTKYKNQNTKGIVRYHIKGQNELSEMYSIFGAVVPVEEIDRAKNDKSICYSGTNTDYDYNKGEGCDTYEEAITKVNLATGLNEELMEKLLGQGNNRVLVCGEARTHCVKSSMEHLMEYSNKKDYSANNIILLQDGSSPIPDFDDNLSKDVAKNRSYVWNIIGMNGEFSTQIKSNFKSIEGGKSRNNKTKKGGSKKTRKQRKQRKHRRQRKTRRN